MTKRSIKNRGPIGHNKSLGNSLVNKEKHGKHHKQANVNIPNEVNFIFYYFIFRLKIQKYLIQ